MGAAQLLLSLLSVILTSRSVNPKWKNVFLTHLPPYLLVYNCNVLSSKPVVNRNLINFELKQNPSSPAILAPHLWCHALFEKNMFYIRAQRVKVLMLIKIPTATKIAFRPLVCCQSERGNRAKFLNRISFLFILYNTVLLAFPLSKCINKTLGIK